MSRAGLRGASMGFIILLVAWAGLSQMALNQLDSKHTQIAIRRVQKAAASLLERAHQTSDDLMMQETVRAFAQAPGIAVACVIDNEKKILADSRASQLGRAFSADDLPRPLYAVDLKEGSKVWGRLVLGISDRGLQSAKAFSLEIALIGVMCLSVLVSVFVALVEKRHGAAARELSDLTALLDNEKKERARMARSAQTHRQQMSCWMTVLAEQLPQPVVLLDHQQRVLAVNQAAGLRLGVTPRALIGKSWQDVPVISLGGDVLGQSLQQMNQVFRTSGPPSLRWCTLDAEGSALLGTWITVE